MQRNAFPNSFKGSRIREHRFVFDRLFDEDCTQDQVYRNTTQPLLDSVLMDIMPLYLLMVPLDVVKLILYWGHQKILELYFNHERII